MVATSISSFIRLAGVLFCLTEFSNAGLVAARARIVPKQVATSASIPASSGTSSPNGSTTSSSSTSSITSQAIISTETDFGGHIIYCTAIDTLFDGSHKSALTTKCSGPGIIASTNTVLANSAQSFASSLKSATAPDQGCVVATSKDGSNGQYCTCGGGGSTTASQASTTLAYSTRTLTTACGSLPTGWVQVPEISEASAKGSLFWARPTSDFAAENCTTGEKTDERCWDALEISSYVNWWWGAFNSTCSGRNFAQCFYETMSPYSNYDCGVLAQGHCYASAPQWKDFQDQWNGLRSFYVVYNIWNLNTFFNSYSAGYHNAGDAAALDIGKVVSIADPTKTKKTNVGLNNLLTALSVGLAFVPGPASAFGKALVTGGQQAPGVAKYLYPQGTEQQQQMELTNLQSQFGTVLTQFQEQLNQSLPAILNSTSNFVPFVTNGTFSGSSTAQITLDESIYSGLMTYLISQAYQANGIFLTRAVNTDVHALETNGTKLNQNIQNNCKNGYDNFGTCDTFWYDQKDGITYALTSGDHHNLMANYQKDMQTWFTNYTTPELLSRNSDLCAQASKKNQGNGPVLDMSTPAFPSSVCVSNMKVCTWQQDVSTARRTGANVNMEVFPLFSDCKNDEVLPGYYSNIVGTEIAYQSVPRSYLGWGVIYNNFANDHTLASVPSDQHDDQA